MDTKITTVKDTICNLQKVIKFLSTRALDEKLKVSVHIEQILN